MKDVGNAVDEEGWWTCVLFLSKEQRDTVGMWFHEQHRTVPCLKIGCTWAILGVLVGPLGAQPILPESNLAGAYLDTLLSLLELHFPTCRTCVHACSKCVTQAGGFHYIYRIRVHSTQYTG